MKEPLSFGVDPLGPPGWHGTNVSFVPSSPIVAGGTGKLANVAVSLWVFGDDGGSVTWTTPATCTLQIVSNACVSPSSLPDLYVISGTGTCTDAAQANMAGYSPVTIGSFYFAAEYQGPSADQ